MASPRRLVVTVLLAITPIACGSESSSQTESPELTNSSGFDEVSSTSSTPTADDTAVQVVRGQLAVDGRGDDRTLAAILQELDGVVIATDDVLAIVRVEFAVEGRAELLEIRDELERRGYGATLIAELDPDQLVTGDG